MKTIEILISEVFALCLGFIWYNLIFSSTSKPEDSVKKEKSSKLLSAFLSFISFFGVAYFMNNGCLETHINGGNLGHGLFHGGLYALSYAIPILAIYHIHHKKGVLEFLIHSGFALLSFASIGGMLAVLTLMNY